MLGKHKILAGVVGALAAVATLAVGFVGASSANAADSVISQDDFKTKQDITVQVASGSDASLTGSTFKAVPLAYYSNASDDGTNITSYDLKDAGLAAAIKEALTSANITGASDATDTNPMVWVAQHLYQPNSTATPWSGTLRDFLDKLQDETAFKTAITNGTALTVASGGKSASASVTPGIYAVVDTTPSGTVKTNTDGSKTYTKAAIIALNGTGINGFKGLATKDSKGNAVVYPLGVVDYKANGTTTISKAITSVDKDHGQLNQSNSAASQVGKNVEFTLTSTVPNWTGYDHFYFAMNDTPSKGLTFNGDKSVIVKVGTKTLTENTDYWVSQDPTTHEITFLFGSNADNDKGDIVADQASFPVNTKITVIYTAKVNQNAVSGTAEHNNATVSYSHNPNSWTDHDVTPPSSTKVYTGKVQFNKTDMQNKAISGAKFQLLDAANSDAVVNVVQKTDAQGKAIAGSYRVFAGDGDTGTPVQTMDTDANGKLVIDGLDGKYVLKETVSPIGSPVLANVNFQVTVDKDGVASVTNISEANGLEKAGSDADSIQVLNAHNIVEMPKTGATGIAEIVILALILAAIAIVCIIIGRRHAMKNSK